MPQPILKEVTYGEGLDILKDDGTGAFEAPHWKDDREVQYPYLYRGGGRITVAEVKWLLPNCELQGPFYASGEGSDENNFEEVQASAEITEEGTVVTATNLYSSISSLDNETKFFDSLEIQWNLRYGSGEPVEAGTSASPVYVCLEEGSLPSNKRFNAVVDLACRDGGAKTPDEAFAKIWVIFESRSVEIKLWPSSQGERCYYYKNTGDGKGTTFADNSRTLFGPSQPDDPAGGLLLNSKRTGRCQAWCELFWFALWMNVPESKIQFKGIESIWGGRDSYDYLLVIKEWSIKQPPLGVPTILQMPGSDCEMNPNVPEGSKTYGSLVNDKAGIPGQSSAPPSEKIFSNHYVVNYHYEGGNIVLCDPSYGKIYEGANDDERLRNLQNVALEGIAFWNEKLTVIKGGKWTGYFTPPWQGMLWLKFYTPPSA